MTTHELARLLLGIPDRPVVAWNGDEEQDCAVTGILIEDSRVTICTDEL